MRTTVGSNNLSGNGRASPPARLETHTFQLEGVPVTFPFNPYDVQKDFMGRLIRALKNGENALLESPTGTGKTLCLLCGALAWQETVKQIMNPSSSKSLPLEEVKTSLNIRELMATVAPPITSTLSRPSSNDLFSSVRSNGGISGSSITQNTQRGSTTAGKWKAPVIIYASRTHSQLSQVMRELKNTSYKPTTLILGSREQLCVHPRVSQRTGTTQNHMCRNLVRERRCYPKIKLEEKISSNSLIRELQMEFEVLTDTSSDSTPGSAPSLPVMDIEDLAKAGKRLQLCPYFVPRDPVLQEAADLILVPYNFILDPVVRAQTLQSVNLTNAIVIFDEAHNLEEVGAEICGFDLSAAQLARCVAEVRLAISEMDNATLNSISSGNMQSADASAFKTDDVLALLKVLLELESVIDKIPLDSNSSGSNDMPPNTRVEDGAFIYALLQRWNITFTTYPVMAELLDSIASFLVLRAQSNGSGTGSAAGVGAGSALESFKSVLDRVFRGDGPNGVFASHFKVVIHMEAPGQLSKSGSISIGGRTLSFWCLTPGVALLELRNAGIRSLILASGTLSPMDSYAQELLLPFPVQLENRHVIDSSRQLFAAVLRRGLRGSPLLGTYENRESTEYLRDLGASLASLLSKCPGGALVFFPSYAQMEKAVSFFKTDSGGSAWFAIQRVKRGPFVEPRSAAEFKGILAEFNAAVSGEAPNPRLGAGDATRINHQHDRTYGGADGAVLFGVCKGRISEGLDFADAKARLVVVVSVPYAPHRDPKIMLKRSILDKKNISSNPRKIIKSLGNATNVPPATVASMTGASWYALQAMKTVNQAIGRVIRHEKDYGAVVLMDQRFERELRGLSRWIRPYVQVTDDCEVLGQDLHSFFAANVRDDDASFFLRSRDPTLMTLSSAFEREHRNRESVAQEGQTSKRGRLFDSINDGYTLLEDSLGSARSNGTTKEIQGGKKSRSGEIQYDVQGDIMEDSVIQAAAAAAQAKLRTNERTVSSLKAFLTNPTSSNSVNSSFSNATSSSANVMTLLVGLEPPLPAKSTLDESTSEKVSSEQSKNILRKDETVDLANGEDADEAPLARLMRLRGLQAPSQSSSTGNAAHMPDAKAYLGELKEALSSVKFSEFKTALQSLMAVIATPSVNTHITSIVGLLGTSLEGHNNCMEILRGFVEFSPLPIRARVATAVETELERISARLAVSKPKSNADALDDLEDDPEFAFLKG